MRSLRARFALAGLVMTGLLLLALGVALQGLFERHTEREIVGELDADLRFLARGLVTERGTANLRVEPLPDPRFQEPFSGLYWQVRSDDTGQVLRSPSLAGFTLPLEVDELRPGEMHRHVVPGPEGGKMIVLERRIDQGTGLAYRVAVAVDRKVLRAANRAFLWEFLPVLLSIATVMLLATALQGAIALRPIAEARRALGELQAGRRERLGAALPSELNALAAEFDGMLDAQRQNARAARERAADLAHGLRTPLALLASRARELGDRGEVEAAREIMAVTSSINARLSRELARAHILGPASHSACVTLAPLAARIIRALERSGAGEHLVWEMEVEPELAIAADEGDLLELLGSLLDNAAKWATSRVRLRASAEEDAIAIRIEDDGLGISPQDRRAALARGVRLDPERSGTGLGLAIAQDVTAAYGGTLVLKESDLGGLSVCIALPAAGSQRSTTT